VLVKPPKRKLQGAEHLVPRGTKDAKAVI
jgi:hypothetical protein